MERTTFMVSATIPYYGLSRIKRVIDIIGSLCALIILAPVMLVLAILIYALDGGPVFFRQSRPGLAGKPFEILKFRTMSSTSTSVQDDERLTGIGKFLRSFSLDELPEFWNVLRGDMSLVGPRPLLLSYLPRFNERQMRRHEVRPGLTGWAQVNGRNTVDWSKRFELDLWYVENAGPLFDLQILFFTVKSVLQRSGISANGTATMHEFLGNNPAIEMSTADISENDIASVLNVLRSGRLALGPKAVEFEKKMADYVGVKHAIAVSSGTAALHCIVKALGIGPGDEVLVPSFTFAASVNAILYEGATPVFVDLTEDTYNLDPADLRRKLTSRTKAIMAVDIFGHPVEWNEILAFAAENNLSVIDDCCEALGAEYRGQKAGSFGAAGAFAFYPNKQITTGEGGMIVTNDDNIARLARSYRNQGRDEMGQWLEHPRLGFNYRLDEMSSALGSSQLDRIEQIVERRSQVARMYSKKLAKIPGIHIPRALAHVRMSWFVYVIRVDAGLSANDIIRGLADLNVPSRAYFSPIHSQPYLTTREGVSHIANLPLTRAVAGQTIALPFHNKLTEAEADYVVASLEKVLLGLKGQQQQAV